MTTDKFYSLWKLGTEADKKESLERLKRDKDERWNGEQLKAVNKLVKKMECNLNVQ